jgi:hypothetical protein
VRRKALEHQDLYVLGIALLISGIIVFKTFQWVLYEEISAGLAALFFGFAVVVFFAINNYAFVRNWGLLNDKQLNTIRATISAATEKGVEVINAELHKHKETMKPIARNAEKAAETSNGLAASAVEQARAAVEIATDAKTQSEKLGSIQAWATWELLMDEFLEIERYIMRWEEKNALKRETPGAASMAELTKKLEALDGHIPETIKALYFERQRKYEILEKLKEAFGSPSRGLAQAGFTFALPARPKLPSSIPADAELLSRNKTP